MGKCQKANKTGKEWINYDEQTRVDFEQSQRWSAHNQKLLAVTIAHSLQDGAENFGFCRLGCPGAEKIYWNLTLNSSALCS